MELHLLHTFDTVATLLSFQRSALLLDCAQSTVSAQIKLLEAELGAPLFQRLGRRIALTSTGADLWPRAKRLLADEEALYNAARVGGGLPGRLVLRVPQSVAELVLPDLLARMLERHPRAGFDVATCDFFHLVDELRAGLVDVAFLYGDCPVSAELWRRELKRERLVFAVAAGHPLAERDSVGEQELASQALFLPKHDCGYRMELERRLLQAGVRPRSLLELNSVSAVLACLRRGLGVALLPEALLAYDVAAGRLVPLPGREPLEAGLHLLCHGDRIRSGLFGEFLAVVDELFPPQD